MNFEQARDVLIDSLRLEIKDARVLSAFSKVPRELFVPDELKAYAYGDHPLSIGYGQTISQPYIVALMTEALQLQGGEKVLEVGTGSGYQSAILAELAGHIYSVERIPELAAAAKDLLLGLGYRNIHIKVAGDELGWKEYAPYETIIVTAAAPGISDELLQQLKSGGRLVIPVGSKWEQNLLKITKGQMRNSIENLASVRFVPLIGKGGWDE